MSAHWYDLRFLTGEGEGRLIRYAGQFLHDRTAAVAAVQDAILRYIRLAPKQTTGKPPVHGVTIPLFDAVRKVCLERLGISSSPEKKITCFKAFILPGNIPLLEEDIRDLRALISTLSPEEQEVLTLHFEQKLSFPEIAALILVSPGQVNGILTSAIQKLRLAAQGGEL